MKITNVGKSTKTLGDLKRGDSFRFANNPATIFYVVADYGSEDITYFCRLDDARLFPVEPEADQEVIIVETELLVKE